MARPAPLFSAGIPRAQRPLEGQQQGKSERSRRLSFEDLEMLHLAKQLIEAGLRLSLVHSLTRVGTLTLREWWWDVHGSRPPNGKLPESVISFVESNAAAQVLSVFVVFYRKRYGLEISATNLLYAWQVFNRKFGGRDNALNINAAYFAVRDVRARIVVMSKCSGCRRSFIYDTASKHTSDCPFCDTRIID